MKATRALPRVEVSDDGEGIVSRAGLRLVAEVAERLGLIEAMGAAMAPTRQRRSAHDPGKVLVDVALTLADGGKSLRDLAVVRNNPELFGPAASDPTAWRVFDSGDNQRREAIAAITVGEPSPAERTAAPSWESGATTVRCFAQVPHSMAAAGVPAGRPLQTIS